MQVPQLYPVEILDCPAAALRVRPHTRYNYVRQSYHVYAEVHGVGLIMDIFLPLAPKEGRAVIDVISGGWHADRMALNMHIGFGVIDALCDRGIAVFAVSPGSLPLFSGLEMVRHVHVAIRHVKANADLFKIDPNRIGIMGVSAGGHLAALTALAPRKGRPAASDPLRRCSTHVQAAALFFPPTDLLNYSGIQFDQFVLDGVEIEKLLFREGTCGKSQEEIVERLRELSPARMRIVAPPPFLLIHGKKDILVPWEQTEKLADTLRRNGGEVSVVYKENGEHGWPEIQEDAEKVADWFVKKL